MVNYKQGLLCLFSKCNQKQMSRNPEVAVSDAVLTVDVGNTAIKLSVFDGETLGDSLAGSNLFLWEGKNEQFDWAMS